MKHLLSIYNLSNWSNDILHVKAKHRDLKWREFNWTLAAGQSGVIPMAADSVADLIITSEFDKSKSGEYCDSDGKRITPLAKIKWCYADGKEVPWDKLPDDIRARYPSPEEELAMAARTLAAINASLARQIGGRNE